MEKTKRGLLFVISGPSGSGKGTIVEQLIKSGEFEFSVSATTRAARPGEEDGVHYYFISREEFEKKIERGEMLEHAEFVGNLYGTPRDAVEKCLSAGRNIILDIEGTGAKNVKRLMPEAVLIMIIPPDAKTLEARLRGRGTESDEVITKRLGAAHKDFDNWEKYDYVVVNKEGKIDEAVSDILQIEKAESMKTSRNELLKNNFFNI